MSIFTDHFLISEGVFNMSKFLFPISQGCFVTWSCGKMLGYRSIVVTPRKLSSQNMLRLLWSGYQSVKFNFFMYSRLPKPLSQGGRPITVNNHIKSYRIISYHSYKVTLYIAALTISCSTRLSLSQNKATTSLKPCMGFQAYFSVSTKQTDWEMKKSMEQGSNRECNIT